MILNFFKLIKILILRSHELVSGKIVLRISEAKYSIQLNMSPDIPMTK